MEITDIISSGMLELYVAGLCSKKESSQVIWWLLRYPEVAAELSAIDASIETYAQMKAIYPSASVKENVFTQINKNKRITVIKEEQPKIPEHPKATLRFWKSMAAASVVLLIASVVLSLVYYNNYSGARRELLAARETLSELEEKDKLITTQLSVVQSKYSVPVALNGLKASPDAAAKIFWMKNTGEVFIDAGNLPVAPTGKQYQLWGIVDGKPVDGGMVFNAKKGNNYLLQKMKSFGRVEAFAITLEPEKGNASPQGPMYVMGKI